MKRFTFILLFISASAFSQSFQWLNGIGGEGYDQANCVAVDSEKNVIVAGTFTSEVDFNPADTPLVLNAGAQEHFFVAKYNPAGEIIWLKHIKGKGRPNSIHLDQDENIFIVGSYEETIDFDPGIEEYALTSARTESGFIQKLNSDGGFIWAKSLEGADDISDLKINSSGDLFINGLVLWNS